MRVVVVGIVAAIGLGGCARPLPGPVGIDGAACVGVIDEVVAGAVVEEDQAVAQRLLAEALGASDRGNLCAGKVYRATAPIRVYRVWNSEKDYTRLGRWWTFTRPEGPRDRYQRDYIICDGWSKLDQVVACEIKVGANFVVGPGQNVRCDVGESRAKSAKNQVFIANDGKAGVLHVDRCGPSTAWPEP